MAKKAKKQKKKAKSKKRGVRGLAVVDKRKVKDITIQQQRFVDILFGMKEPNNRQAYIQAGYKSRGATADVNACRLLKRDKVQSYLNKLRAAVTEKTEITATKVVRELGKIAFSNIKNYLNIKDDEVYFKDFSELTDEQAAAVESIKVMKKTIKGKDDEDDVEIQAIQFKLHSKTNTLEQLGKHLGIYQRDNAQKAPITLIDIIARMCSNGNHAS